MSGQRHDLAATFVRVGRALVAAERPLLAQLGLEMWDYVVLVALRDGPAHNQAKLAHATGRGTTRLIPLLDRLEERGLVRRTPDPADRRNRVVELTEAGAERVAACQAAIRRMEAGLLAEMPAEERVHFIATLERVADLIAGARERL